MATIAPWISVAPRDYLDAAQAGHSAGLQLASLLQSAKGEQDRNAIEQQQLQQSARQAAAERQFQQQQLGQTGQISANQLSEQAKEAQARNLISMVAENRMLQEQQLSRQDRLAQLGLEGQRVGLEADRFLRPRFEKAPNGALYSFDANGQITPLASPTKSQPAIDPLSQRAVLDSLDRQRSSIQRDYAAATDPDTKTQLKSQLDGIGSQADALRTQLLNPPSSIQPVTANPNTFGAEDEPSMQGNFGTSSIQPSLPAGPSVGDAMPSGGVWAGGGTIGGSGLPQPSYTPPATSTGTTQPDPETASALQAIAGGADPNKVSARYKQRTGRDLPLNGQ